MFPFYFQLSIINSNRSIMDKQTSTATQSLPHSPTPSHNPSINRDNVCSFTISIDDHHPSRSTNLPQSSTAIAPVDVPETYPEGDLSSWLVVLGSFFLLLASYGLMTSIGVFQSYLGMHQLYGYSARDIGVWKFLGFFPLLFIMPRLLTPELDSLTFICHC